MRRSTVLKLLCKAGRGHPLEESSRSALCLTYKAETRGAVPRRARTTDWLAGFASHLEHVCGVARCTRRARTPRVAQTIPRTLQQQSLIASRVIFRTHFEARPFRRMAMRPCYSLHVL